MSARCKTDDRFLSSVILTEGFKAGSRQTTKNDGLSYGWYACVVAAMIPVVAHALLRAASSLTRRVGIDTSVDAARRSACATSAEDICLL